MSTIVKLEHLDLHQARAELLATLLLSAQRPTPNTNHTIYSIETMSIPRFFVEVLPASGPVQLSSEDARHAQSVLRLKAGDEIQLFDGKGNQAQAQIVGVSKSKVQVEVQKLERISRELPHNLNVMVALPKGDRQKVLVDLLVQLGASQLTPLESYRGVAQPTDNAIQRLERSVIESSKQCGRNLLMQVIPPLSVESLCDSKSSSQQFDGLRLFAHPYGARIPLLAALERSFETDQPRSATVLIGPEGGFTEQECEKLNAAGWTQVCLGDRILRVEAAAAMIAATWAAVCQRA
ncbi:MAG: RsmE family RNA methyltransferase [Pirellulales bacterium]